MKSLFQILAVLLAVVTLSVVGQNRELRGTLSRFADEYQALQSHYAQIGEQLKEVERRVLQLKDQREANRENGKGEERAANGTAKEEAKPVSNPANTQSAVSETSFSMAEFRVQALQKLVDLSPEQTEKLREKYESEARGEQAPSLDSIIGEDLAQFVKEQRKRSFEQSERESIEKEAYFLSRRLDMTRDQEDQTFVVLESVELELKQWREDQEEGLSPRERMFLFVKENRLRRQLTRERLAAILESDQIEKYAQYDAQSSAADVELWHGGGANDESSENPELP